MKPHFRKSLVLTKLAYCTWYFFNTKKLLKVGIGKKAHSLGLFITERKYSQKVPETLTKMGIEK